MVLMVSYIPSQVEVGEGSNAFCQLFMAGGGDTYIRASTCTVDRRLCLAARVPARRLGCILHSNERGVT
jgi:hypothetical protein